MTRKIESIDFFYLSMPEILDIGDGSQDALLVRVSAGGHCGWGECEASPLPTIAALVAPMSHSACKPVAGSVLGQTLDNPTDIARIHRQVRENSLDLLQADHALSGIDTALWDLLGRVHAQPVYHLLGYPRAYPKTPYFSVLFGQSPVETLGLAHEARSRGFRAVKFGWGPYGRSDAQADADQVTAAREGLGPDGILCIDAGTVWGEDVAQATERLAALEECGTTWLEEPFHTGALHAYQALAGRCATLRLAGGEGAHNEYMAMHMIDYAGLGFIQVDCGRIGGITSAKRVAEYAAARGVTYVNHTFTSHLALSASLQSYAGLEGHVLCEYPGQLKALAWELTGEHLLPDENGQILPPAAPGLGLHPDPAAVRKYLVETEITVAGKVRYRTPEI
jgi:L-alanine-DL-glutamate epimerase-like enolase superfamily enzyme